MPDKKSETFGVFLPEDDGKAAAVFTNPEYAQRFANLFGGNAIIAETNSLGENKDVKAVFESRQEPQATTNAVPASIGYKIAQARHAQRAEEVMAQARKASQSDIRAEVKEVVSEFMAQQEEAKKQAEEDQKNATTPAS
jgi:hypothetical protein